MTKLTFFRAFSPAMMMTGLVAVLVGYASSVAIILQALEVAGLDAAQTGGWLMMLGIGMGVTTIGLSLWYKMPVLTAWSTPGIALLVTSLSGVSISEAVGVFIFASGLMFLCGVTGIFARLMNHIPRALASAMLAGILLRFGLTAFGALDISFVLCAAMIAAYVVMRRFFPLYAIIAALITGIAVTGLSGDLHFVRTGNVFALPEFVMPSFTLTSLISVGIPFFIVSLASQNAPGIAILQANGYPPHTSVLLACSSLAAMVLAPWGGFSICIAAITAAICMAPDVHPDPARRYTAAVWAGIFYLLAGIFGGAVFMLFNAFPAVLIQILAGLALLTTLMNSLHQSLADEKGRDAAIICFLLTASGITLLGISSAFWGLLAGIVVHQIMAVRRR
ncbi:benzoate/H(+) symporter BenE family transporter [Morganella morganii]|uniref:benzoate/H(+) symporter BenE family transporter n=1 Tax=Morganella morganii TaxID=582 RepID=UPI000DD99E95|nr:benzoate/H(+) symporter BenE family transporter [Morganella morganii]MDM8751519.1 benzoate/H(+) symporter BenE family transporter [Morganella morganii]